MTASQVTSAAVHGAADMLKSTSDGLDRGNDLDDGEGLDEDEVEVIPLRVEPLPQQNASPIDIDKGLRLIQSCRDGDFAAVQRQVAEGSPAGFVTKSGWTPTAAAAYSGKSEIVRYLLDLGADGMYVKFAKRYASPSSYAQQQQQHQPVSTNDSTSSLGSAKPSFSSEQLEPHHAVANDSDNNLAIEDPTAGSTALPVGGVLPSGATVIRKLLGNGSNTPLHWACYTGHAEIVTILLHAGYSIEDVDPIGNRALHLACSGGFRDVIEILLAHSAALDQRNKYGNKPLDLATDLGCRKLLHKFQSQTCCEWCKESFSRIRKPSLCQHCHNVYCDVKPCSSITEVIVPPTDALLAGGGAAALQRSLRYCQECATEMGKTEQDLRSILDSKLALIRSTLEILTESSTPPTLPSGSGSSRPASQAADSIRPATATPDGDAAPAELPNSESANAGGGGDMDGVEPPPTGDDAGAGDELEPPQALHAPTRRLLTSDEISRALTLSQTDAEALYTCIEAAQLKAVDRELIDRARQTYRQLVAHVALQEEIKSLMVVRPIAVRSLIEPLKSALVHAKRENVSHDTLMLGVQVIRSAEAECTLCGCEALCTKIELGTKKQRRDIARLEASITESQQVGVNDKLVASAVALRDRLNAEVQLQSALLPFTPVTATGSGMGALNESVAPAPSEPLVATGYRFDDGVEVATLLLALERRNQLIQSAVDFGATVDGVSSALLEESANVLKQLKKDIKDEQKNEDERRRLEEEAALKAAKKGKKKKA